MSKAHSKAKPKNRDKAMLMPLIAALLCCYIAWLNWPIKTADAYSIIWQLVLTVGFVAFGIWISEQKWSAFKKASIFGAITTVIFVCWNLAIPLVQKVEQISCSNDIMLFKDGSGSLLAPQIYALFDSTERYLNGELSGYNEMSGIDQWASADIKNDDQYDQKLIATAALSWMHNNRLDWSGCAAEPMFIGLSGGSQGIYCDRKLQGKEISLQDLFGPIGKDREFFFSRDMNVDVPNGSGALTLNLENPNVGITFSFSEKLFGEELKPHKEGTKPIGIEENIARYYKAQPKPLSDSGFRVKFMLKTKPLRRWSIETKDYQQRARLFCDEFEKSFSWKLMQERLESSFINEQ